MDRIAWTDSEFGQLSEVLLCSPGCPTSAQGKPTQESILGSSEARDQHRALIETLQDNRVTCHMIEPSPNLYYQCFMRDAAVVTPWGLLLSRMSLECRGAEPGAVMEFAKKRGINIWKQVQEGTLEGGDILLVRPGLALVGCSGWRTSEAAAIQVKSWFENQGWECRIINYSNKYVHLDLILGVVDSSNLLYGQGAIADHDLDWFGSLGFSVHGLPPDEIENMGCNILSLGCGRILSACQSTAANQILRGLGYSVLELDISRFVYEIGGIHCLVLPLVRESPVEGTYVS